MVSFAKPDRVGLVVERDHGRDRAEHLLARDAGPRIDRAQHHGGEPVAQACAGAAAAVATGASPSMNDATLVALAPMR